MAPINEGFDGYDMSNNLFSDLGPLIALLGEQVTRQFLGMSLSWPDNILLAMGPVGVITIIVSAIRIGGPAWLKACVGRAREERSVAEQELLSSTSNDICEMWSGKSIVRTKGQPKMGMPTLVIDKDANVRGAREAWSEYLIEKIPDKTTRETMVRDVVAKNDAVPNLALTVSDSKHSTSKAWPLALVGLLLQLGAIVVSGIARYLWLFPGSDGQLSSYGYPMYLSGSILLSGGIVGCGRVIEAAMVEQTLVCPKEKRRDNTIVRLQRSCKVGDQQFGSFAIFNPFGQPDLYTSTWKSRDESADSALHWSATVIQLAAAGAITIIRTYGRRGLGLSPPAFAIHTPTHEIAWLALGLHDACELHQNTIPGPTDWKQKWEAYSQSKTQLKLGWEVTTGKLAARSFNSLAPLQLKPALKTVIRRETGTVLQHSELQYFSKVCKQAPDALPPGVDFKSRQLVKSIEAVAELLRNTDEVRWKREHIFDDVSLSDHGILSSAVPVVCEIPIIRCVDSSGTFHHDTVHYRLELSKLTAESDPEQALRWHCNDLSDLQGILCSWLRTLDLQDNLKSATHLDNRGFYAPRHFFRLVGRADAPHHLVSWMGWSVHRLNRPPNGYPAAALSGGGPWGAGDVDSHWFGAHLPDAEPLDDHSLQKDTWFYIVTSKSDIVSQCAQELFVFFILAIAAEISSVLGTCSMVRVGQGGFTISRDWNNSLLTSIAEQAVWSGLVDNLEEALTLVIPAFAKYDLLPDMTMKPPPAGDSPPRRKSC